MRISSQERHPGWLKRRTRELGMGSGKDKILGWFIILPPARWVLGFVSFAPPGLAGASFRVPRLTPWAAFCRRFAAGSCLISDLSCTRSKHCRASLDWTADGCPYMLSAEFRYSICTSIFAVFSSMAETEQYFSWERRTASSIALGETLPPTRYLSLISVYTAG